jgi:hypothetical protein
MRLVAQADGAIAGALRSFVSDDVALALAALSYYGEPAGSAEWLDLDREAKRLSFLAQARLRRRLGIEPKAPTSRLSRLGTAHFLLAALEQPSARAVLRSLSIDVDALAEAVLAAWFEDPLETDGRATEAPPRRRDRLTTALERLVRLRSCIDADPRSEALMPVFDALVDEVKRAPLVMPADDDGQRWRDTLAADITRAHREIVGQLARYGLSVPDDATPSSE